MYGYFLKGNISCFFWWALAAGEARMKLGTGAISQPDKEGNRESKKKKKEKKENRKQNAECKENKSLEIEVHFLRLIRNKLIVPPSLNLYVYEPAHYLILSPLNNSRLSFPPKQRKR